MLDDGHRGLFDHGADQAFAAARDDHIDAVVHLQHGGDGRVAFERHELERALGHACGDARVGNALREGVVRAEGLAAAAEDDRVAGFDAESGGVDRHVRAGFVDDRDDTDRHGNLVDAEAVRTRDAGEDTSDRIVEPGHMAQGVRHVPDAFRRQGEAFQFRRVQAVLLGLGQIFGVGGQNDVRVAFERIGHRQQPARAAGGIGNGERTGSAEGAEPEFVHRFPHVGFVVCFADHLITLKFGAPETAVCDLFSGVTAPRRGAPCERLCIIRYLSLTDLQIKTLKIMRFSPETTASAGKTAGRSGLFRRFDVRR